MTCLSAVIIKENEAGDFFFQGWRAAKNKKKKENKKKNSEPLESYINWVKKNV